MARKTISDIAALLNITLEGNLIAPAMLAKVERLEADGQRKEDYAVKPGLTIRDEIPRAFRIGQALFSQFSSTDTATAGVTLRFVTQMLTDVFGFTDLQKGGRRQSDGRDYLVHLEAGEGRIPVIVIPPQDTIDRASDALAFDDRKRSASTALQDWLNAEDEALWGLATNGDVIRLMRDNASLTRPAFVEADLKQIFETEDYSSFSALWLLLHRSRFGDKPAPVTDCALERWRDTGSREGAVVRDRLRDGVEDALRVFGSGFLEANPDLRKRLSEGDLKLTVFFNELLRIIYRLIFLMVAEDRDLLHDPDASPALRQLYAEGYSLKRLRERSIRRSNWDKHRDLYEGLKIVFRSLATGQSKLGLPALGGLFDQGLMPDLDKATLPNRALMEAVYRLAWLKEKDALLPINWREMETEELGSVYESLLELTPRIDIAAKRFYFAEGEETKGNQRKTTGSYYTPDSLVQVLLDSALDPVLDRIESKAEDPADALTKATVIDPACGSGHFLLAAARRIATRVARIRAGGVASATDFRHALRDVARGCIHGVDRNPMAVELTKVALWIETVEPGRPLGFLDANIRCGDALLGVFDLSVLREGIPDAAYKPLTGDDKDVAKYYREKNKRERKERSKVESGFGFERQRGFTKDYSRLRAMPEDTVEQVKAKTKALQGLVSNGSSVWELQQACDLYIASFLSPKVKGGEHAGIDGLPQRGRETVPTSGTIWEYLRGITQYGPLVGASVDEARSARVFHWPLEFPDVFDCGGFDLVIGNPPWERIKLQEKEFFASRDTGIATAANKTARDRLIRALSTAETGSSKRNLFEEFQADKRSSEALSEFVRVDSKDGGRFALTGTGDVNTYALFAELFSTAVSSNGRAGVIVPTGIATDATTAPFFASLVTNRRLASLLDFENRERIFPSVYFRVRFCLLCIGNNVDLGDFASFITDPLQLADKERRYSLSSQQISRINPNTKNAPVFRTRMDADITARIYDSIPIFIRETEDENVNPWGARFMAMFHMSNDSAMFRTSAQLINQDFRKVGSNWISENSPSIYVPLQEAKMMHQFDHRRGDFALAKAKGDADYREIPEPTSVQRNCDGFEVTPRYWVPDKEVDSRVTERIGGRSWLMGWRDITNATNERTVIASILPRSGTNHKIPLIFTETDPRQAMALLANLNSLVLDFVSRQKVGGTNLTYFLLKQFPVLSPESYSDDDFEFIKTRVLELTYTSHALQGFARDLGFIGPPFKWDEGRRAKIRAELDAFFARSYQLTRDDIRYILDPEDLMGEDYPSETFRVLKAREIRQFNEYRTQRLVLEAFDKLELGELGSDIRYEVDALIEQPIPFSTLPDAVWARTTPSLQTDPAVALAAILKAVNEPTPIRAIRMTAIMMLEPHLFTPLLTGTDRAEWQRLVGQETNPQIGNLARLPTLTSPGWNTAITNHRGNGRLIEDLSAGTWLPGTGLEAFDTAGWPDGRASFALRAIHDLGFDTVLSSAPQVIQEFVNAA